MNAKDGKTRYDGTLEVSTASPWEEALWYLEHLRTLCAYPRQRDVIDRAEELLRQDRRERK